MSLMNLIRSLGFLAIGWTVLALGVGALGVWTPNPPPVTFYVPKPSLHQVVTVGKPSWSDAEQIRLLDQVTGESEPIRLPSREVWALLTVSPWRDRDGNLEVVGRWARHLDPPGERAFSGLGLFRLPDATVVSRIPLDMVPTGRPCVLPGGTGEILFPSGDGALYRCSLSDSSPDDVRSSLDEWDEGEGSFAGGAARQVRWRCERPGAGPVIMNDPFWSSDQHIRSYVFVSLSTQERVGKKIVQGPQNLWWLKMNDTYDEIEAAGPLNCPAVGRSAKESVVVERFPTIAVDGGGKLGVLYMTRRPPEMSWQLHSARLERTPETQEPYLVPNEKAPVDFAARLAADPPLLSADGKRVFARTTAGELATIELSDYR